MLIYYLLPIFTSSSGGVQLWQADAFRDLGSIAPGPSCFIALDDIRRHVALQQVFIDETRVWATILINKVIVSNTFVAVIFALMIV